MARLPAEFALEPVAARDQLGRVAGTARLFDHVQAHAGDALDRVDDLAHAVAVPIAAIQGQRCAAGAKMVERLEVRGGQIVARWLMNLSISLDHRLVDGWDGAMFLQDVKALLEDPTTMFMEMV